MHPADRQSALKKAGVKQKDIAKELGIGEMPVSHEINGVPISERIREAIARKIGKDKQEVFPQYYSGNKRLRKN